MLTITHTHEAGTLIDGTSRGDGTAEILKANGWRWGRSIAAWYVPHSRDRLPKEHVITRTAAALEAAGYELAPLELDRTIRSTAEVEADKAARQEARVDALQAKADRKSHAAAAAWQRHYADVDRLPESGEPVKLGHHSEQRHRRALEKAHDSARRGVDADREADRAAAAAEAATHTTAARNNPVTVANRITKLAADIRRIERNTVAPVYVDGDGYRPATAEQIEKRRAHYAPRLAELTDQHAYWEAVRAEQIATGQATNYSAATVHKGDLVKIRGHWSRVLKANPKTVAIDAGPGWDLKYIWAEVTDHRPHPTE